MPEISNAWSGSCESCAACDPGDVLEEYAAGETGETAAAGDDGVNADDECNNDCSDDDDDDADFTPEFLEMIFKDLVKSFRDYLVKNNLHLNLADGQLSVAGGDVSDDKQLMVMELLLGDIDPYWINRYLKNLID